MNLRVEWKPVDFWVGLYTEERRRPGDGLCVYERHVWVCVLPMIPIHIWWEVYP